MIKEVGENFHSNVGGNHHHPPVGRLTGGFLADQWHYSRHDLPACKFFTPVFFYQPPWSFAALFPLATGSSWTTSATVGIALIGIGKHAMPVMVAGRHSALAYLAIKCPHSFRHHQPRPGDGWQ
ncbi:MAG: hypothetical protein R2825_27910 [Saprospiraceae bacterium]